MTEDLATKHDLERAIDGLKIYIEKNENSWLRWLVGIQLSYFAVTIGAMFFIAQHVK